MSTNTPVFSKQYVAKTTSSTNETTSSPIRAMGNRAVLNATIQNISITGTVELKAQLQGSYDGQVWLTTGLGSLVIGPTNLLPAPKNGSSFAPIDDVVYCYLRLRAELTTDGVGIEDPRALFDADLVLSQQ